MQIQKPNLVNVIAWTTLTSGIVNLVWGVAAVAGFWWTVICIPFLILPTVLGVFEIIYAAKLMSNPPQAMQPSTSIAIFEIISILYGNVFAMVVGILALVFYNDQIVRDYFARLNGLGGMPSPVPVPPVPPAPSAPIVDPVPAPVIDESPAPAEEPGVPEPEAPVVPEKPKRSRKVAGE
jgi:hypothetical protein